MFNGIFSYMVWEEVLIDQKDKFASTYMVKSVNSQTSFRQTIFLKFLIKAVKSVSRWSVKLKQQIQSFSCRNNKSRGY
jgi:hypothetical protein